MALKVVRWHIGLSFQGEDRNTEVTGEQAAEANRMEHMRKYMAAELDQDWGRILVCVQQGCGVLLAWGRFQRNV